MDITQAIHMCISGITSLAALYFKMAHGKLETRVAVLEERSQNEANLLNKLDDRLDDIRKEL